MVMKSVKMNYLSKDEIQALCSAVKNGKTETERKVAVEKIILNFQHKIIKTASDMLRRVDCKNDSCLNDMVAAGMEELNRKIASYDTEKGNKAGLWTYAESSILKAMNLELNNDVTEAENRNRTMVFNARKYYEIKHNGLFVQNEASIEALSDISGLSVKVVKQTLNNVGKVSLDQETVNEEGSCITLADTLASKGYEEFMDSYDKKKMNYYIRNFCNDEDNAVLSTLLTEVEVTEGMNSFWLTKYTSEREGVRILQSKGYDIGRGTLNSKRKALANRIKDYIENGNDDFLYAA